MKRSTLLFVALLCCSAAVSSDPAQRPPIRGIGSVTIAVTTRERAMDFYSKTLRLIPVALCESGPHTCMGIGPVQRLEINSPSSPVSGNFLGEVSFLTADVRGMKRYLDARHIKTSEIEKTEESPSTNEMLHLTVVDPEGHSIGFVQYGGCVLCIDNIPDPDPRIAHHLIHAGFIVRDRAATEHFYKDILGFRPYWRGGMKDDQIDWVSMQVPDGTDWLEFMVNVEPDADQKLRGIMNHIALGVPDIHAAQEQLLKNGAKLTEGPKIGRDGKWQLNVYDPDLTRVEFMEFTPVQKPCCSEFTGPHPGPQRTSKAPAKP